MFWNRSIQNYKLLYYSIMRYLDFLSCVVSGLLMCPYKEVIVGFNLEGVNPVIAGYH